MHQSPIQRVLRGSGSSDCTKLENLKFKKSPIPTFTDVTNSWEGQPSYYMKLINIQDVDVSISACVMPLKHSNSHFYHSVITNT